MNYVDIHNHSLYGIDDGAESCEQMQCMLDDAYRRGTRVICFTPHLYPGMFSADDGAKEAAFLSAKQYVQTKYPDLELHLACELRYSPNCMSWFHSSKYGCLDGQKAVLVDFAAGESANHIIRGLHDLLSSGYLPVLAHGERYRNLPLAQIRELRKREILIQVDTQSFSGGFGIQARIRANRMLAKNLIDMVSSDAHDCARRPPDMQTCYCYIKRKKGAAYAQTLFAANARQLLYNG